MGRIFVMSEEPLSSINTLYEQERTRVGRKVVEETRERSAAQNLKHEQKFT